MHTKNKPLKCDQCNKSFKHATTLRSHKRIHARENLYQCNQCDKTFTQSGNLKVHKRTHTEERPFKCSQCGKQGILRNMKEHMQEEDRLQSGTVIKFDNLDQNNLLPIKHQV